MKMIISPCGEKRRRKKSMKDSLILQLLSFSSWVSETKVKMIIKSNTNNTNGYRTWDKELSVPQKLPTISLKQCYTLYSFHET